MITTVLPVNKVIVINRAVLLNRNSILLVKNTGNNFWHLPGGKFEPEKESLPEGCLRELREELAMTLTESDLSLLSIQEIKQGTQTYLEFIWKAKPSEAVINSMRPDLGETGELDDVKWIGLDQLKSLGFRPQNLIDIILNDDDDVHFLGTIAV